MRFYKMRRYEQLVFRTIPDSLLEWLNGELEKRGIDCVYTHCILSILQDGADAEPDEFIDARNSHKIYHKLENLYSATKTKHLKWKSYSKQILLTTSIPCFDVGIADCEQKNKIAAINCLKSVSDDNTIEELIEEVCMELKNMRNMIAPEKKEPIKSTNKIDKDTAFYIPPSSPTDQVEKYFAAFPPLDGKEEEKIDSSQVAHLNICYANCIKQSKNSVNDIFVNSKSFQNSENSKYKQDFSYGSLKSIENIYQPEAINKTVKCKLPQPLYHNANNLKFVDENGFSDASFKNLKKIDKNSSVPIVNSDRNKDCNNQNYNEKCCSNTIRAKHIPPKSRKCIVNKSNYRSEKEPDSKRKSLLNFKPHSNPKKAKNSCEIYFSTNKFSVLMEEEIYKLDTNPEEHMENVTVGHSLKSERKLEASELTSNPCKKFKIGKNPNLSENIFFSSTNEEDKVVECSVEMSFPCLQKYDCDKKQHCKDNSCIKNYLTLEMHAKKKKSDFENNVLKKIDGISPCKKISRRTKYANCVTKAKRKKDKTRIKDNFEGVIKENLNVKDINDSALKLYQGKAENLCASKIQSYMPEIFIQASKICNLNFMKMRGNINVKQSMYPFLKVNSTIKKKIILCEENKVESSSDITNETFTVSKEVFINNSNGNSLVSLYFPPDSKRVGQQNFTLALANVNSIIIGNNTYYKFNASKALSYFSPHEIFNIITIGDNNEVNNFLKKFSVQSNLNLYRNSNSMALPDERIFSENCSSIDLKMSDSLPLIKYSDTHFQPVFAHKRQSTSILSIDFQSTEFKDENFCDNECSKDSLSLAGTQQKIVEYKNHIPAIFGNWNYNLLFDLDDKSSGFSNNASKYNNLSSKTSFAVTDFFNNKEMPFRFSNRLFLNENDYTFSSSEQLCSVKDTNWNIEDIDMFNNYNTLSTSFSNKNSNFRETYFSYATETPLENKFACLTKNADDAENLDGSSCPSSAFRCIQKKQLPFRNHSSVRCQQNILKKVTNIDRIIQKINAQNRVNSFLNAHTSLKLSSDNGAKSLFYSFRSPYSLYSNDTNFDSFISLSSNIAENDLSSNYNLINSDWLKKGTGPGKSLRAIWENKDNSVIVEENNDKTTVKEDVYTLFDDFDSIQNDLKGEDGLLKTIYSDSKGDRNQQVMPNSMLKSSYVLNINSKNESLEKNVEDLSGISEPMIDIASAKTMPKISDNIEFDFSVSASDSDTIGVFATQMSDCVNTIDSHLTCSDTDYSFNMKDEYQDSSFIDVSAFRGPYGSYSENKTNYLEGEKWNIDCGDNILGSDTFHCRSSSLHELETTGTENDSFQQEHLDQQKLFSRDSKTLQLNTRLPFGNARRRIKHKCSTFKRPCAFYMEGNCNRSDCKYSHDLSNITCRFWIEGSCFKGSTCPFLHGYVEHHKIDHHNFTKCESRNYYSLDSEADFPSLSSAKCEKTPAAKSSPVDIICAKGFKNSRQANQ